MNQFYTDQQAQILLKLSHHKARLIPCEPRTVKTEHNKIYKLEKSPAKGIVAKTEKGIKPTDQWQPINAEDRDDFNTKNFSKQAIKKYIELGYKIAIVPNSINACVIDIDNPEKTDWVIETLGKPVALIKSKQEGRVHLYYKNLDNLNTKNIKDTGQIFSANNFIHIHHPEDFDYDFLEKLEKAQPTDPYQLTKKISKKNKETDLAYSNLFMIRDALSFIDPDEDYDIWIKIGMALHASSCDFDLWDEWSQTGNKYTNKTETKYKWNSFNDNKDKNITLKTLFQIAKEHGWQFYELILTQDFIANAYLEENKLNDTTFNYIYCKEDNKFFLYNKINGHWEENNQLYLSIREYVNKITAAEKPAIKRQFQTHYYFKEITNIIKERVAISIFQLDNNPDLIGCPYGVYNLETKKLEIPIPEEYITKTILCNPYSNKSNNNIQTNVFDTPESEPTIFMNYMRDLTENNTNIMNFLLMYAAYSLTGHTHEEKAVLLHGPPQCGKSTFTDTIRALANTYGTTMKIQNLLDNKYDNTHRQTIARLFDKRLVEASEPRPGSVWKSSELNNLISGEEIEANNMRQNSFTFFSISKFIISANHAPRFNSLQDGLVRRLEIVRCQNIIPEEKQDKFLLRKILDNEKEKIIYKLFEYLSDWKKNGLIIPSTIRRDKKLYVEEQDIIAPWLEECCDVNLLENKFIATTSQLYMCYKEWCKKDGDNPVTKKTFGKLLQDKGIRSDKRRMNKIVSHIKIGIKLTEHGKHVLAGFPEGA